MEMFARAELVNYHFMVLFNVRRDSHLIKKTVRLTLKQK